MAPLPFAVLLLGLTASARAAASPQCGARPFASCLFPSGYTGVVPFKETSVDSMYKEVCANARTCVDNYVNQCLDGESKAYYTEAMNASVSAVLRDVCQEGPLKADIMKHRDCWKQDKVDSAMKQCKKAHHFAAQLIKALTERNVDTLKDDANVGHCVGYTLFARCHAQLIQKCDVTNKDCIVGYAAQMVAGNAV